MNISFPPELRTEVRLPASKSISARALIINALMDEKCPLDNLSTCDDTAVMQAALRDNPATVDVGAAGTAMRFLTAYYATRVGEEHVVTGSERMRQRPIGPLVDALRAMGADVAYEDEIGFPPLRVKGRKLKGGVVRMPASTSSQFVSALLLIAPTLKRGLTLMLKGRVASRPYIAMSLSMMRQFGAACQWTAPLQIDVFPQPYVRQEAYEVEPDWSAASYWYEMVALSPDADARVVLHGLRQKSVQGDSAVAAQFHALGVTTQFTTEGAVLTKQKLIEGGEFQANFSDTPDLAQTFVVTCAMLHRKFHFTGLRSLRIKETDRIAALCAELAKFGVEMEQPYEGVLKYDPENNGPVQADTPVSIATYNDHRMAMSFAPVALLRPAVAIENPEVVSKSYPTFWDDVARLGGTTH